MNAMKLLKKMTAKSNHDPLSWLAACDLKEEMGEDASALRSRAKRTLAIAAAVRGAISLAGPISGHYRLLGNGYAVRVNGGLKVVEFHVSNAGERVSVIVQADRVRMDEQEAYLYRKAAQVADSAKLEGVSL